MAATSPSLALAFKMAMTSWMSSSETALSAAWRNLAVCRAKGLPGPPRLPFWKRPFASRSDAPVGLGFGSVAVGSCKGSMRCLTIQEQISLMAALLSPLDGQKAAVARGQNSSRDDSRLHAGPSYPCPISCTLNNRSAYVGEQIVVHEEFEPGEPNTDEP